MNLGTFLLLVFTHNAVALGNGPAMIPLVQKDLVEEHQVLNVDQFLYAFAIGQVTPGQGNLYVASFGYMLFGLAGAVLATLAIVLPAYLMLPLDRGFTRAGQNGVVRRFSRGMTAATVGLILATAVDVGRSCLHTPAAWLALLLTLALTQLLRWKPFPSLLAGCSAGAALLICCGH